MKKILALALSSILFSSCQYFGKLTEPLPKQTVRVYYVPSLQEADNVMYYNRDCEVILPIAIAHGNEKLGKFVREAASHNGNVLIFEVKNTSYMRYKIYRCIDPYVERLKAISMFTKSYEVR